jgi:drug/metabolite transporter (DMT)-like permease
MQQEALPPRPKDFFLLHFIVLLWGFTAILGKLTSLIPADIVLWRTGFAAIGLWLLYAGKLKPNTKHQSTSTQSFEPITPKIAYQILATGSFVAIHWFLFFLAARVGNVSSCLAGIATGSVWAALLEPAFERRRPGLLELGSALAVLVGLLLIYATQASAIAGVAIGVCSAMFAALFSIANRHFVTKARVHYGVISAFSLSGAFIVSCLLRAIGGSLGWFTGGPLPQIPQGYDWLWLNILAWLCTVFAFSRSVALLQRFSAFSATLAVNMEPVYGILLAYLIFGESEAMSTGFYLGTSVVLLAVIGHPLVQYLQKSRRIANTPPA